MRQAPFVPIKDSIAAHLLKVVFALYLVIVVTVTLLHLLSVYVHTKTSVLHELEIIGSTFKPGLEQALWEMNLTQMHSIMAGIVQLPAIVGVRIEDDQGGIIEQVGRVLNLQENAIVINQEGTQELESSTSKLFGHEFPLFYARGDQEFPVGNVTMYSSSGVVFERIRFGFLLLLIAAAIQIIAFWMLFLWISRTRLSRPLAELTYATGQLDLDNLENVNIRVHTTGRNELKILEEAFNTMIQKLLTARETLQELNRTLQRHRDELERRVQERTTELRTSNQQLRAEILERQRVEDALQASEAELRALFGGMTDVVLMLDREGRYLKIAPTSPELLYKPVDELIGKTLHEMLPHEQADIFLGHIRQSLETQQLVGLEYNLTIGETNVWFDGRVSPMSHDTVIFVARDISTRKQMEDDLRHAKEAAEAANRAKSTFLANMSHELRTPLHIILGFAQQLERDAALTAGQQQSVDIIYRNGEHLLTMLTDILDFTKIEANRFELHPSQFVLHDLLAQLVDLSRHNAEQKDLSFVYDAPADLPHVVYGDQKRLRRILLNLLENAIRFTEQGNVTLKILDLGLQIAEGDEPKSQISNLKFEISDTGIGIAAEHLETIFQPFQQADPQRLREGSRGLGLAISRRFVHMMGGQLHVTSTEGAGSAFWFKLELPVIDTPATDVPNRMQADGSEHSSQETLTRALAALPSDWLATLREGAVVVDIEALSDIINRICKRDPMPANALARLAEEFEYDEILSLVQEAEREKLSRKGTKARKMS